MEREPNNNSSSLLPSTNDTNITLSPAAQIVEKLHIKNQFDPKLEVTTESIYIH